MVHHYTICGRQESLTQIEGTEFIKKIKKNVGYQTTFVPDEVEPDQALWDGGYKTDFLHSVIFIIF